MNSLVYFPSFEPQNEKWLKFSLLYLDEFRPIIPDEQKNNISDLYKSIINETDLIKPYSPKYIHGRDAGIKSFENIDKILLHPERYTDLFGYQSIEEWKNKNKWNYFIYEEKFSYEFKEYCLRNKLGMEVQGGIRTSKTIGYIFMKNLANEISKTTKSSIITDSQEFEEYDTLYKENYQVENNIGSLAESVINLKLPTNINYIDFEQIINFRNEHRDLIHDFQISLEQMKVQSGDISAFEFLGEFNNIYSKSMSKTIAAGLGISLVPLSIYSYFESSSTFSDVSGLKEWVGIISGITGTGYTVKEIINETQHKRKCIKYFADLKELI